MGKKRKVNPVIYDLLPDYIRIKRNNPFLLPTAEQLAANEEGWLLRWDQFIGIQSDDLPRIDAIKRLTLATWIACSQIENVLDVVANYEKTGDPDPVIPASEFIKYLVDGLNKARAALNGYWNHLRFEAEHHLSELSKYTEMKSINAKEIFRGDTSYGDVVEMLAGVDDDYLGMLIDAGIQERKHRNEQRKKTR